MDLSVKNTTREQRKQIVKEALSISVSGTDMPNRNVLEIAKEYVDGKIEITEVQKRVLMLYKKEVK